MPNVSAAQARKYLAKTETSLEAAEAAAINLSWTAAESALRDGATNAALALHFCEDVFHGGPNTELSSLRGLPAQIAHLEGLAFACEILHPPPKTVGIYLSIIVTQLPGAEHIVATAEKSLARVCEDSEPGDGREEADLTRTAPKMVVLRDVGH